ncbi:MAG: hypothetical protein ABSH20_12445 [Tepidisphaeraceae bacterium]|jgi:hypothetical protein
MLAVKNTDGKGRVTLGGEFANRTVTVEQIGQDQVIIRLARVIPENEAWLYENPAVLEAVRSGLSDTRAGRVGKGPNLKAAAQVARKCEDSQE